MKKILVCDDDNGILEVITIILETNNYEVKTVNTGKAIQKRIKEFQPDLIFLDIWMPGIEGREIVKLLKASKETSSIPIIIISALSEGEIKKIIEDTKADDYLSKPFDMQALLSKVEINIKSYKEKS